MIYTFTIAAPPPALSPNSTSSRHWRSRHTATKRYKELACVACKGHIVDKMGCPANKVRVSYLWGIGKGRTKDHYRPRDDRNGIAALKALDDGMVLAGLVPDDSRDFWEFGRIEFCEGNDWVQVTVEVLE